MAFLTRRFVVGVLMLAGIPTAAFSQLGSRVSVVFNGTIDSNQPGSGLFVGQVKNPVTIGGVQVAAGSNAMARLVPSASGATRTWSISLVSVAANGQNVAVSSTSAIPGAGAVKAVVADKLGSLLNGGGGIFGSKTKQQQQSQQQAAPMKPSTSGARVYLPAGSEVIFMLGQVSNQRQQQAGQQATAQPAAQNQAPQPAVANSAQSTLPDASTLSATPVTPDSTPTAAPAQGNNSVLYENILYQLQGCQRQSPHIVCNLRITNQRAVDAFLAGGQGTYYVDQAGNRVQTSMRKIANCIGFGNCQLLPGVTMAASFEFVDEDGHATNLVRFAIGENGKAVAEFNHVPVQ